jgi:hypothetical protein
LEFKDCGVSLRESSAQGNDTVTDATTKPELPLLAFSPDDFPILTNGVISRTRAYKDMRAGLLRAKKVGDKNLVTADEARRYIDAFPDRDDDTS